MDPKRVDDPARPEGVPNPGDGPKEGVPTTQEGGDGRTEQTVDVESIQAELEQARQKLSGYESQIDELRASYDQRYARDVQAAQAQAADAEERMHQIAMAGMDEQERIAYERDIERQRRARLEQQMAQMQERQQAFQNMNQYAQMFTQMGADYSNLDFSSPENLYQSGIQAAIEARKSLEDRLKRLEEQRKTVPPDPQGQAQSQQSTPPGAPPIMGQHGAQPDQTKTIGQVLQALQTQYPNVQWTEDLMMTEIEHGRLPITLLDGVNFGMPLE